MVDKELKKQKLKRLPVLRIMNWLGMVAWSSDEYDEAKQNLRLIHPLTWLWVVIAFAYGVLYQGVPQTLHDISDSLKNETLWW